MKNTIPEEQKNPVRIPDSMEAGLTDDDLSQVSGGAQRRIKINPLPSITGIPSPDINSSPEVSRDN